ncbi:capsid protein [Sporolactobacillus sp. CQH2019]|uniref:capsid protein n=1 Tax=Sporolactobacillus sp. CQH2019 TaxID=3023512 RepID=UPI0023684B39|nr:capsid protein [Sporolactobacillus sp. CQH2019]MDD9147831.1 capsid protein [Sporolactobacillus sp. CQH2019]
MAVLNYAEIFNQQLFQAFFKPLMFSALWGSASNSMVKFLNAHTVQIPHIDTGGATDVNRDTITGFTRNVDNSYESKTLTHYREFSTLVDPQDVDETNVAVSIANIQQVYNREKKVPELDRYMISKLYSEKVAKDGAASIDTTNAPTTANVLDLFDQYMMEMDDSEYPDDGRVLYVTPAVHKLMKGSDRITRFIDSGTYNGQLNRAPQALDGVPIIVVPSSRMKTLYNFTNGAVADPTAGQINMLLCHPGCVLSPMKYEFVNMEEPSAHSKGKFLYYENFYCDVFLFDRRSGAVKFNVTPAV